MQSFEKKPFTFIFNLKFYARFNFYKLNFKHIILIEILKNFKIYIFNTCY